MPFVVAACQDPEVSRYSPVIPFPYTESDAVGWLASQEPARLAGNALELAVVRQQTGERLGAIGVQINVLLRSAEIGYWLAPEARGRGYISRATRALARWVFDDLNLARLQLTTDPDNRASQRVAERCGFSREGHLRSHMLIRHSGRRRDSLVYGLLPGELTNSQRRS
ncbi:MAG: GNAT family N-acetyltransferase [Solirubrobacterales bacterium]|nr:GNAT family N-acetyltransferase [Solirubrobacterales bacterium]